MISGLYNYISLKLCTITPNVKNGFFPLKTGFCQKDFCQTNEHQRHWNELAISDLHWEEDSIQTSLKLLFTLQQ